jgi:pimeloyl-ACP methyl ester carboxylesterase
VLLLHGSADSEGCWRDVMASLADGVRLVAPSLVAARGRPEPGAAAIDRDLEWLAALVAHTAPIAVVGHSYGALLALRAALSGVPLGGLGLLEPIAFGLLRESGDAAGVDTLNARFFGAIAGGAPEEGLRWLVEYWNGPGSWGALPAGARARLHEGLEHTVAEVRSGREDRTRRAELEVLAARLPGPALVMAGERTTDESLAVCALLGDGLGVERRLVAGAGHQAPRTHGGAVAAAIKSWLGAG